MNARQPDDPGPFHLDFAAEDAASLRRTWKLAFGCLVAAALVIAALTGPVIIKQWDRIEAAVCAGESVV